MVHSHGTLVCGYNLSLAEKMVFTDIAIQKEYL